MGVGEGIKGSFLGKGVELDLERGQDIHRKRL